MSDAKTAYDFFVSQGLSPGAATGVVGNLLAESGLSTTIRGDGGKAVGIAQWHPDRFAVLKSWAAARGLDPYALGTQLRFARYEAGTAAGGNVWSKLLGVKDAVTASALWMRLFERPKDQSDANARKRAQKGVDALKGAGGAPSGLGAVVAGAEDLLPWNLPGAAASGALGAVRPLILESAFVVLALALVGVGVVRTFPGVRQAVTP